LTVTLAAAVRPAAGTSLGLVDESLGLIELLLPSREDKRDATIAADERLIDETRLSEVDLFDHGRS
jgi:hypothetical protein